MGGERCPPPAARPARRPPKGADRRHRRAADARGRPKRRPLTPRRARRRRRRKRGGGPAGRGGAASGMEEAEAAPRRAEPCGPERGPQRGPGLLSRECLRVGVRERWRGPGGSPDAGAARALGGESEPERRGRGRQGVERGAGARGFAAPRSPQACEGQGSDRFRRRWAWRIDSSASTAGARASPHPPVPPAPGEFPGARTPLKVSSPRRS